MPREMRGRARGLEWNSPGTREMGVDLAEEVAIEEIDARGKPAVARNTGWERERRVAVGRMR